MYVLVTTLSCRLLPSEHDRRSATERKILHTQTSIINHKTYNAHYVQIGPPTQLDRVHTTRNARADKYLDTTILVLNSLYLVLEQKQRFLLGIHMDN